MSTMSKRKYRMSDRVDLDVLEVTTEKFRIDVDRAFQKLISDPSEMEYSFPSDLNNLERKYIHQKAANYNLHSRSHGKDPNRTLTVSKRHNKSNFESFYIDIAPESQNELAKLNFHYRINCEGTWTKQNSTEKHFRFDLGPPPPVVPPVVTNHIAFFQKKLPIFEVKDRVKETIRNNKVVIISSETGSGKTTQIPQYIMEDCLSRSENCRVLCTQPRRISAVSVAERVAEERGSHVGDVVGYQVRLETKLGPKSNLIYCTNGVLIRNLMLGDAVLRSLTHIIIDEVHERDKLSDFLLICLRESLRNGSHIKLILMSATINIQKFHSYFESAAVLKIPGRLFNIRESFLDEILEITDYGKVLERSCKLYENGTNSSLTLFPQNDLFDEVILSCSREANDDVWHQLLSFMLNDNMPPNYQNSLTGLTALMVAVNQDNVDMVEKLCTLGCDPTVKNNSGLSALDLAEKRGNDEIILILNMMSKTCLSPQRDLLSLYYKTVTDDEIDFDLLTQLICVIHEQYQQGAILVFLPGYDDIMIANERIECSKMNKSTYKVFFLHGSMNIKEQHEVFKPFVHKRKIILSTNIAETSLTIDDVVYVIDSGKAKVLTYDSCNGLSSLQTQWISKACVKQRAGRAGRTNVGMAFHLFSKLRYESLLDERIPEILRVPLEELCLNTKTLAKNFPIYDFLVKAPDPPSPNTVKTAIENLECLGALDSDENLTPLGEYLSQLTIEPHLGKMLIYSAIFKCLDPILTIVACLAQKDPFQLPPQANKKTEAAEKRKTLYEGTLSDHFIYLRAFLLWQSAVHARKEKQFCSDFFISASTMETILKTRSQLLRQLRETKFVSQLPKAMNDSNVFSDNWPLVKAVISAGLYPKMSFKKGNNFCTRTEKKVLVSNSNTLNKDSVNLWLVYDELIKVRSGSQIRGVTPITPITISLMCGIKISTPLEKHMAIDEWLEFEFPNSEIINLRSLIDNFIEKKLSYPTNLCSDNDFLILKALAGVLLAEELAVNMMLPVGINQRPKFFEINRNDYSRSDEVQQILRDNAVSFRDTDLQGPDLLRTVNSNNTPSTNGAVRRAYTPKKVANFKSYLVNKNGYYSNSTNYRNREGFSGANHYQHPHHRTNGVVSPHVVQQKQHPLVPGVPGSSHVVQPHGVPRVPGVHGVPGATGASGLPGGHFMDVATALPPPNNFLKPWNNYDLNSSRFFLIKARKQNNILIAFDNSCWTFAPNTEKKILAIDNEGFNVFLFYQVPEMHSFYGLARFISLDIMKKGRPLGRIEWLITDMLPWKNARHLRNPLNDNRLVFDAEDGQEIDQNVAVILWELLSKTKSDTRRPTNHYY